MILPVDFLWHQLNGPQAKAIEQAIYDYWKQMFDDRLEYLNQLTIDNANDSHLNLFGIIANFVRPVIQVPDKDYFLFTEHDEHDNEKGLAAINNRAIGGRLTSLKGASTGAHALDTEFYRTLLQTYRDSEGELDSFILLDDICNALSLKDKPDETPAYEFSIVDTVDPGSGRGPGDVYIDIGSLTDWANPFQIYAVINGLANSVFYPLPRIWTSLDTDVRCHTPTPDVTGGTYGESVTVELSCTTPGSTIYYTLDGTEPTQEEGIPYTVPLVIDQTTQLKARAWAAEKEPSFVYSTTYIIQTGIQLPQVMSTLATGTYTEDQLVTLNCPFGLPVSIRYTLDDSEPTLSSPEYTEPFMTTGNMKLKAKAFRGAYEPSETLVVDARIMPPAVVIGPDIWTGSPTVTLTCTMAGVTILYSTDGNTPRTEYTEPFVLNNDTTVKAMAVREGYTDSVISEKYFEINQVPPVESSMPSGVYTGEQTVTLSCPMSNVQIRYTLDGSDPTEASTDYVEGTSITIPNGAVTVLKAKAWKGALSPSEISTWTYECSLPQANTPVASPAAGDYFTPQSITLSCDTPGSSIYYTLDGTEPDTTSTLYTGPIELPFNDTNVRLRARAYADGYSASIIIYRTYRVMRAWVKGGYYSTNEGSFIASDIPAIKEVTRVHFTPVGADAYDLYIGYTSADSGSDVLPIYYSIDGITWTRTQTTHEDIFGVTGNTNLYGQICHVDGTANTEGIVAIASEAGILKSVDGREWILGEATSAGQLISDMRDYGNGICIIQIRPSGGTGTLYQGPIGTIGSATSVAGLYGLAVGSVLKNGMITVSNSDSTYWADLNALITNTRSTFTVPSYGSALINGTRLVYSPTLNKYILIVNYHDISANIYTTILYESSDLSTWTEKFVGHQEQSIDMYVDRIDIIESNWLIIDCGRALFISKDNGTTWYESLLTGLASNVFKTNLIGVPYNRTVDTPTTNKESGSYTSPLNLTVGSWPSGWDSIRYTLNGTEPNMSSSNVPNPQRFPVSIPQGTTTLKLKGYKAGYNPSDTAEYEYIVT